jgi:hypothetical protein
MAIVLATKPGINGANILNIPKDWDATWFRTLINNSLKGADVRNAVGANGIVVTGNISTPYATISFGPGPITLTDPTAGTTTLTVSAPGANGTASNTNHAATFLGAPNAYAVEIDGSPTTGESFGLLIDAGTNASDVALLIRNAATTQAYLEIFGDGHATWGPTATTGFTMSAAGAVAILAATGASALTVTGASGQRAIHIVGSSSSGNSFGLLINAGTTAADTALNVNNQANTLALLTVGGAGAIGFGSVATTTTAPGAGGAGALPATPKGYFTLSINGTAQQIAYY